MAPVEALALGALVSVVAHLFEDFGGVELFRVGLELGSSLCFDFFGG